MRDQQLTEGGAAGDGRAVALLDAARVDVTDAVLAEIAAWMVEAGQPFLGWFLGDLPERTIQEWARRDSSEFALRNASLLIDGDRCVGGILVLGGAELSRGRLADMQALLRATHDRDAVLDRVRASRNWFLPVGVDDLYVSKVAVAGSHRGRGLGRRLIHHASERAKDGGYSGVRLDVVATNRAAVGLYEAAGFRTLDERYVEELGVAYRSMRLGAPS